MPRNKKLEAKIAEQPCAACGVEPSGDSHHILTVGSHPHLADKAFNMIPLCRGHHTEVHSIGLTEFVNKYCLISELLRRGFRFNDCSLKWYIPYQGDNHWL